ncbi:MAG: type IX secretion system membrane protein PorP/SprF [Cyclobacteriaceae bacterium]
MSRLGFYIIFCLLTLTSAGKLFAQQDAQFSQYMFNSLYITPAAAGADGVSRFIAMHRSQWLGYQSSFDDRGAPTSQFISFNAPIHKLNSGAGGYLLHDKLGNLNNLQVQALYAYHLGIGESKLSFGIKLGVFAQTVDGGEYRYIQEGDDLIINGKETQVRPDVALGMMYRNEKFYAGFGVNHLTNATFDFGKNGSRNALERHLNFTAGYYYDVSFDLQIMPTVLVKTDFNEYSFDLGAIATYRNTMWGGLSFRQSEALNVILGYALLKDKSLKLGYSIDIVLVDKQAKSGSSHELMLTYDLPISPGSGKKIIRTPRYRH